jgi:hypothetical protein
VRGVRAVQVPGGGQQAEGVAVDLHSGERLVYSLQLLHLIIGDLREAAQRREVYLKTTGHNTASPYSVKITRKASP